MEQPRFFEARGAKKGGEWLVLDAKHSPPRVICKCVGWHAPKDAAMIVAALEAHHSELYSKFALGSAQQRAANPSFARGVRGVLEPAPPPNPAVGKLQKKFNRT